MVGAAAGADGAAPRRPAGRRLTDGATPPDADAPQSTWAHVAA